MRDIKLNKDALHRELVVAITAERDRLIAAQKASSEGVVSEESRSESDKDMRSTEASYLARGQAIRVEALEADRQRIASMKLRSFTSDDAIAMSALVTLETSHGEVIVFLAPAGGGVRLGPGGVVQVVTHASPLGRALLGAHEGDTVEVPKAGALEEIEIVEVA
ncbi:MAG: GreA/GreB family elongation factor [Polyangiaceae bacterium]|nr:GreA/GreB family elongation factor [Polyangiaceae bacterium]